MNDYYSQNKHSKSKGNFIYYYPECKECTKKRSFEWINNNRDKFHENLNKYNNKPDRKQSMRDASKVQREAGKQGEWQKSKIGKKYMKEYGKQRRAIKTHEISIGEWRACKLYFNNSCAYCGLESGNHYVTYRGRQKLYDFSKDHFDDMGCNDLSNCVPSCRSCNSQKWTFDFNEWYIDSNEIFSFERSEKIHKWINEDYKIYIKDIS